MSENSLYAIDDSVLLFDGDKVRQLVGDKGSRGQQAVYEIFKVTRQRPKNLIQELQVYRKYAPVLLEYLFAKQEAQNAAVRELSRNTSETDDNKYRRWSAREDEALIEAVCEGATMKKLSNLFGRSPAAISSHISVLVGRKRLSQEIAGKFIGSIDGVQTEADIVGTVYKEGNK